MRPKFSFKLIFPILLVLAVAGAGLYLAVMQATNKDLSSGMSRASEDQIPHSTIEFKLKERQCPTTDPKCTDPTYTVSIILNTTKDPDFVVSGVDLTFVLPAETNLTTAKITSTGALDVVSKAAVNATAKTVTFSANKSSLGEGNATGLSGEVEIATLAFKTVNRPSSVWFIPNFESAASTTDTNIIGFDKSQPASAQTPRERLVVAPLQSTVTLIEAQPTADPNEACVSSCRQCLPKSRAAGVVCTMEVRPEDQCYAKTTCERQPDGQCGFTPNAEFTACMGGQPTASPTDQNCGGTPCFGGDRCVSKETCSGDVCNVTLVCMPAPTPTPTPVSISWDQCLASGGQLTPDRICITPDGKKIFPTTDGAGEGQSCNYNSDCKTGLTCYQPPMPPCPAGMACAQVMPAKYCTSGTATTSPKPTSTPVPSRIPVPNVFQPQLGEIATNLNAITVSYSTTNLTSFSLALYKGTTKVSEIPIAQTQSAENKSHTFSNLPAGTFKVRINGQGSILTEREIKVDYLKFSWTNVVAGALKGRPGTIIQVVSPNNFSQQVEMKLDGTASFMINRPDSLKTAKIIEIYFDTASRFPAKATVGINNVGYNYILTNITHPTPGDIYSTPWGDGIINTFDVADLMRQYNSTSVTATGDLNQDGVVNSRDLVILKANFGKKAAVVMPALAPTPILAPPTSAPAPSSSPTSVSGPAQ